MKKRILALMIVALSLPFMFGFRTYNYSYYGEEIASSPGMVYNTYMDSKSLGITLSSPQNILYQDNKIYLLDGGSNNPLDASSGSKLVIINEEHEVEQYIREFTFAPEFAEKEQYIKENAPEEDLGKLLSNILDNPRTMDIKKEWIYIGDTNNNRIVKLNFDFEIVDIFYEEKKIIENLSFKPISITVDNSERIYVVIEGAHEGIIELSKTGQFNRFVGTNKISLSAFDIFKRLLMTEKQKEKLMLELSTSFLSVNINEQGFIYATANPTKNNHNDMIQLINPKGVDVLKRTGYFNPVGDVNFLPSATLHPQGNASEIGPSKLVDIAYTKNGMYTVLDQKRSRFFTYDQEGNLLYINGIKSTDDAQSDKIQSPVALTYMNDDILVVDNSTTSKKVVVYSLTDFGTKVNLAIEHHINGEFEEAARVWGEVIKINTNYEIAYNGIGKSLLREKKYKEAMENFKLGHDKFYYSKAFKGYRNDLIKEHFTTGMIVILGLVAGGVGLRFYLKGRKKNEK